MTPPPPAASAREPLKPCPFCGRSDRLSADASATENSASVYCGGCGTLGPSAWGHEDNVAPAIAAWNARPSPAEPPAGVVDEEWNAAIDAASKVARFGCLVPPDGGCPTQAEVDMCIDIGLRISALKRPTPKDRPDAE